MMWNDPHSPSVRGDASRWAWHKWPSLDRHACKLIGCNLSDIAAACGYPSVEHAHDRLVFFGVPRLIIDGLLYVHPLTLADWVASGLR